MHPFLLGALLLAVAWRRATLPYADLYNTVGTARSLPVRGRVLAEGVPDTAASTPAREISQRELPNARVSLFLLGEREVALGEATADAEGYLDVVLPASVAPGRYTLEARLEGQPIGRSEARLLPDEHDGIMVRSDIDLTYLDTRFVQASDLVALLLQPAAERRPIPGMSRVFNALRAGASGAEDRPLVFVSGSPRFFKRVLEARMVLDGVAQDGIFLKPFDVIVARELLALRPANVDDALREQVAYKLGHLYANRLHLPASMSEVLIGDDAEADVVAYALYHRSLAGELVGDALAEVLRGLGASDVAPVVALAEQVRAHVGRSPVRAIHILRTPIPNPRLPVAEWAIPHRTWVHDGAASLMRALHADGLVGEEPAVP